MSRNRYPPRRFDADGQPLCRGCGQLVPKGRRTWCSQACYDRHDWRQICRRVWVRDAGTCQICRRQIGELKQEWMDRYEAWRKTNPRPRPGYFAEPAPNPQFDHIVPFSEGGPTVDENIRLVCTPCHLVRTREWRRARRQAGQLALELKEA